MHIFFSLEYLLFNLLAEFIFKGYRFGSQIFRYCWLYTQVGCRNLRIDLYFIFMIRIGELLEALDVVESKKEIKRKDDASCSPHR